VAVGLPAVLAALLGAVALPAPRPAVRAADWIEPVTGIPFVLIRPGSFLMGSPAGEAQRGADETPHEVRITRPFYMGRYEVTQDQWAAVMGDNPSRFRDCGGDCPVENVSAEMIRRFLDRLEEAGGARLRLPTEAEWEYTCRAGTTGPYSTGAQLAAGQANIDARPTGAGSDPARYLGHPTPVGSYPSNGWGLFDMHGNVWEWCADRYCPYPSGVAVDPLGVCDSDRLVIRGGSWYYGADSARSALRYTHMPVDSGPSLGFRLARDADAGPGEGSAAGPGRLDDLGWLAGCWRRDVEKGTAEEQWNSPRGGIMLGLGRTVVAGRAVGWELLRIEEREGRLVYTAIPSGQQETSFVETQRDGDGIVFENLEHDFPQRVAYTRRSDGSLLAWIEGTDRGASRRTEFPFTRGNCAAPASRAAEAPPGDEERRAVEKTVRGLYDLVTFEAGSAPDWGRVRSLFVPGAVITQRTSREAMSVLTVDAFIADFVAFVERAGTVRTGFTERVVRIEPLVFGAIASVMVLYEAHIPGSARPPQRGVDVFQLVRTDGVWRIAAIANELTQEGRPLPPQLEP